ncbi:hypothetical protein PILCRDRAFT_815853 [Piloderma croceum F 1598]|uniref:Secreted protein n=1 Tax=Piloderma croceum (strain F 1598) TaxID=765440 RepID=A0A0C3BJV0_PILCF|nr:hypothetical protein PILCRDRAFT_815853 [Piloderma croceum F 1598]
MHHLFQIALIVIIPCVNSYDKNNATARTSCVILDRPTFSLVVYLSIASVEQLTTVTLRIRPITRIAAQRE